MTFRTLIVNSVAATTALTILATASSAHAFAINNGDKLEITSINGFTIIDFQPDGVIDRLDFGSNGFGTPGNFQVDNTSTGAFAALRGNGGLIKDLTLPTPNSGQRTGFLQIYFPGPGSDVNTSDDIFFDLDNVPVVTSSISTPFGGMLGSGLSGSFRNATGALLGKGLLTAQFDPGQTADTSSWSMRIKATSAQVPTPALLPGLIAVGLGVLRKRKGLTEQAEGNA